MGLKDFFSFFFLRELNIICKKECSISLVYGSRSTWIFVIKVSRKHWRCYDFSNTSLAAIITQAQWKVATEITDFQRTVGDKPSDRQNGNSHSLLLEWLMLIAYRPICTADSRNIMSRAETTCALVSSLQLWRVFLQSSFFQLVPPPNNGVPMRTKAAFTWMHIIVIKVCYSDLCSCKVWPHNQTSAISCTLRLDEHLFPTANPLTVVLHKIFLLFTNLFYHKKFSVKKNMYFKLFHLINVNEVYQFDSSKYRNLILEKILNPRYYFVRLFFFFCNLMNCV